MSMRNTFLRGAELALLVSGAIFSGWAAFLYVSGRMYAEAAVAAFHESAPLAATARTDSEVDSSLWSAERVARHQRPLAGHLAAPIAVLRVSSIHLEVPVFEGTSGEVLNRGVGRIAGTARVTGPGNIGIAGHRDGFFRRLKDLKVGDPIELQTVSGTQTYMVDAMQLVAPEDVSVLRNEWGSALTLVTCFPFYFLGNAPQRYIVHARVQPEFRTLNESAKASSQATASRSKEITP